MKRSFDEKDCDLANCLMLLSNVEKPDSTPKQQNQRRVFECKTCFRKFTSFQALGGHRTSHKRVKLMSSEDDGLQNDGLFDNYFKTTKCNIHRCTFCRAEFPTGQALGGHMRRHRAEMSTSKTRDADDDVRSPLPILKRLGSSKRILSLDLGLDLSIMPRQHHEMKLHQFL